jgi:hypothetical protein
MWAGAQPGRRKGCAGALGRTERRRQVLAQGRQRAQGPRVNDILIAVIDGLKGFPAAITSVFPQTTVQACVVELIRNSLAFGSWKDRKAILPAIKAIYRAENADMVLVRLEEFEAEMRQALPGIGQAWPGLGIRRAVLRVRPRYPQNDLHAQPSVDRQPRRGCEPASPI